jgi:hypothetical protein
MDLSSFPSIVQMSICHHQPKDDNECKGLSFPQDRDVPSLTIEVRNDAMLNMVTHNHQQDTQNSLLSLAILVCFFFGVLVTIYSLAGGAN